MSYLIVKCICLCEFQIPNVNNELLIKNSCIHVVDLIDYYSTTYWFPVGVFRLHKESVNSLFWACTYVRLSFQSYSLGRSIFFLSRLAVGTYDLAFVRVTLQPSVRVCPFGRDLKICS